MIETTDRKAVPPGLRGVRLESAPTVSVVVASCREPRLLRACLESLAPQCARTGAEIIVARPGGAADAADVAGDFPAAVFVAAPPGSGVPELRARGMAAAQGDVVALTEDHCVVADDWLDQITRAHRGGSDVVGGAMDNAQRERSIDWAAYFAEYGFFAESSPAAAGEPLVTGANVAYSRRVVDSVIELAMNGEWENIAHTRLSAEGRTFRFLSTAAVYQNRNYTFREFCRDRYEHGRDYARRRLAEEGSGRRWIYLPGSVVLPFLLTLRVARAIARRHRGPFLRALPLTFAFLTAWSAGEAAGYWLGPAAPKDG